MKLTWDFHELNDFGKEIGDIQSFQIYSQLALKELTHVLHEALFERTPIKTGNLVSAWGGAENYAYTIQRINDTFYIELINRASNDRGEQYGLWVNDGHKSYNQYGGSYGWVRGRFFVEKSMLDTELKADSVVYKAMEEWFERTITHGKRNHKRHN